VNAFVEKDYQLLLQKHNNRHRILRIVNGEDFQMIFIGYAWNHQASHEAAHENGNKDTDNFVTVGDEL
jgi:hypothetical protein